MELVNQIVGLVATVVGFIVTALAVPDAVWKRRAIITIGAIGVLQLVFLILGWERNQNTSYLFSAFAAIWSLIAWFFSLALLHGILILAVGIAIGWHLHLHVWSRRAGASDTISAIKWPRVALWMSPSEAIQKFVDPALRRAAAEAHDQFNLLSNEYEQLQAKTMKDLETPDHHLAALLAEPTDEMKSVKAKYDKAQLEAIVQWNRVRDDLIEQLKAGILVARGLPFDDKKLQGDREIIKSAYWSVLVLDSYNDPKCETASGGDRTYKGIQIGKDETTR